MLEGKKPEECIPEVDIERLSEFIDGMYQKWLKGRKEHGVVVKIDPWDEAMAECLDIANYAQDAYFRIKKLKEKVYALADKTSNS